MRALVLAVGRPFHWGHIALSLEGAGYETFILDYRPGVFSEYASNGIFFDLIISTRHGLSCVHNEIFMLRGVDLRKFKFKAVIYQYDDVFSELITYFGLRNSFANNGFSVKVYIWLYCDSSCHFLKMNFPDVQAFFSHSPLHEGIVVCFDDKEAIRPLGHRRVETLISPLEDFLDRTSPHRNDEFSDKIVYFGSYHSSFYKDFNISQEESSLLFSIVQDFMNGDQQKDIWNFIEFSKRKGEFEYDQKSVGRIALFSWYFSYTRQKRDRLSIIRDIRDAYGDKLFLAGPGWIESGIKSFPTNVVEPMAAYSSASVCLDLGSQFIDSCLYQRTLEILLAGGSLLQKKTSNTDLVFSEFSNHFSFEDFGDFQQKYNKIKNDSRRQSRSSEFRKGILDVYLNGDANIQAVLNAVSE